MLISSRKFSHSLRNFKYACTMLPSLTPRQNCLLQTDSSFLLLFLLLPLIIIIVNFIITKRRRKSMRIRCENLSLYTGVFG